MAIFIAEWFGAFKGINDIIYAHTPLVSSSWVVMITDSASLAAFVVYLILFLAWDFKRCGKLSRLILNFAISLALGMAVVVVLKALTEVPRPNEFPLSLPFIQALLNADYFAFPSGHTARAAILAYFLSRRFPKYAPIWWIYAVLIALSRLLLHVHWFSDVLFSLLLGPWTFMLVELTESFWLPIYSSIIRKLGLEVFAVE
ncbi:membrane-associated phosphatase [Pyrococcus yayanosii CH1]|uniref:Membrane-associated phosphatase n=1 Tax=Pyrococcus yayanosii (strain CH1 / JCM 16557) TaxID=529709 RepID=F8AG93_PYRYC|nr:membrane-associated phosphatase [Pyrococcus yayanosii CH1]